LPSQADAVLTELRRLGWKDRGWRGKSYSWFRETDESLQKRYARPGNVRLMASIRHMLAAANRPWNYADALAKRMCGIDRLEWCSYESLLKVHTALKMDERRRAAKPVPSVTPLSPRGRCFDKLSMRGGGEGEQARSDNHA
ncbi:MAG: regulatory protein GemA, partial [Burkholderiales bacterium]|nr:regulatory protein GemA [Burkholderiales bacterium]